MKTEYIIPDCPLCGASGSAPCKGKGGRDHKARLDAERAAKVAHRKATREVEPRPWDGQAVGRIVTAEGKRVAATGTEHDLTELAAVREALEDAIRAAVAGLVARDASWSGIGEALGVTKSAAFQRYAAKKVS